jgi:hypothetical protein
MGPYTHATGPHGDDTDSRGRGGDPSGTGVDGRGQTPASRGSAAVVGVVLLVGVATMGALTLAVFAGAGLDDAERRADVERAENAVRSLDRRVARTADGRRATVDLDLGADRLERTDRGWLRVRRLAGDGRTIVTNRTLGAVVYERGGVTVGFQGGGVFRADGDHSAVLSAPPVDYRDGTLALTVVSVVGDPVLDDEVALTQATNGRAFPRADTGENPLGAGAVSVTVQGQFYRGWGRYLAAVTPGTVAYDRGARTATVTLGSTRPTVGAAGIVATARSGDLRLAGTGAYTDSYNSSAGSYAATRGSRGDLQVAGDVFVTGNAAVEGDVRAGGRVDLSGTALVDGDLGWTDGYGASGGATVTGRTRQVDGVETVPPVGGAVNATVDRIAADNDNDATSAITGDRLSTTGGRADLEAGQYYLDRLDLRGEQLVLDTSDGDVEVAVREWVRVVGNGPDDGQIRVVGDGRARLYVAGERRVSVSPTGLGSRSVATYVGKGSSVDVPGRRSTALTLFAPGSFRGAVAGSMGQPTRFEGVINAPAGPDGDGWVYVKQADVYGAVVAGEITLGQFGAVHYDRAVERTVSSGDDEIEFLHVRTRTVDAEDR